MGFSWSVSPLLENPDNYFHREDFSSIDHLIPRRMESVSASGEAYNSRNPLGKVDFDMSSVSGPTPESNVFHGFGRSPARFGMDFRPRASVSAQCSNDS